MSTSKGPSGFGSRAWPVCAAAESKGKEMAMKHKETGQDKSITRTQFNDAQMIAINRDLNYWTELISLFEKKRAMQPFWSDRSEMYRCKTTGFTLLNRNGIRDMGSEDIFHNPVMTKVGIENPNIKEIYDGDYIFYTDLMNMMRLDALRDWTLRTWLQPSSFSPSLLDRPRFFFFCRSNVVH